MSETLIILGASARAAAFSALRAGYRPVCGDWFADDDLQAVCPVKQIERYPAELAEVAAAAPAGAWLYTGGLENYPSLVDRVSRTRPLLGVAGRALRRVRDPLLVARTLRRAGLAAPECRETSARLPTDGSWLLKGRRSSGGGEVLAWRGGQAFQAKRGWYFQQRIEGVSQAAVFVAAGGEARLAGVTEQLLAPSQNPLPLGEGDVDAFRYAGSMGPLSLSARLRERFEQIGNVLAREFDLAGLFGVDCIVAGEDVRPVEVNPRYTASVEVLEWATGMRAIAMHVAACREKTLPRAIPTPAPEAWFGKRVVYFRPAPGIDGVKITAELAAEWQQCNTNSTWPVVADLPGAGAKLAAGQPVFTLFASAADRQTLCQKLARDEAIWQARLAPK
ncbi:MAG TPA: ATP-grasp domain-containing protein [Pirellulales bacterium]|nr:ATP-grasp domain-containing protein [Pirellulales bacterium]